MLEVNSVVKRIMYCFAAVKEGMTCVCRISSSMLNLDCDMLETALSCYRRPPLCLGERGRLDASACSPTSGFGMNFG